MLQQVCEHLHNYFIRDDAVRMEGEITIAEGAISPIPALIEGQRFLVTGSILNDGMYTYHAAGIKDDDDSTGAGLAGETFHGAVIGLSIPPQVGALSARISEWVVTHGAAIESPYQSESFGGYSYTRAQVSKGNGASGVAGWQEVFKGQLDRWRRIAF